MKKASVVFTFVLALGILTGCGPQVQSVSGTKMATVEEVKTGSNGLTVEQQNISDRIIMDNQPGAIKHLYVVSAYSGQVIIYSTVRGKVTSSGKRLTPDSVVNSVNNFRFNISGMEFCTDKVLGEDGTYGSSIEYLYWWDAKGVYHQQYVTGGMILHVSDQPLAVKGIIINMEITQKPEVEAKEE
ncbi:MAG: hypothetical protein WC435_01535 [Candidatus Paceibacterota bacterium]